MWRLLLGTMGVKSRVQGLNAAATAGFEPRTVWSEVRRRNRLATAPPSSFNLQKPFLSIAINEKVKFDGARCPFRHFCVCKVITTAHAHESGVIFYIFEELSNKKIKALRPKMTKIASRGPALKWLLNVVFLGDMLTPRKFELYVWHPNSGSASPHFKMTVLAIFTCFLYHKRNQTIVREKVH